MCLTRICSKTPQAEQQKNESCFKCTPKIVLFVIGVLTFLTGFLLLTQFIGCFGLAPGVVFICISLVTFAILCSLR